MPSTATITGKVGPGSTITAQVFNNVTFFSVKTTEEVLEIDYTDANGPRKSQVDISAATTITCTVSGANYTLTIS
jgi:hypothetical protein